MILLTILMLTAYSLSMLSKPDKPSRFLTATRLALIAHCVVGFGMVWIVLIENVGDWRMVLGASWCFMNIVWALCLTYPKDHPAPDIIGWSRFH